MVTIIRERDSQDRDEPKNSVRSINMRASSANDENMTIDAVLSTETPVRMYDCFEGGRMDEVLLASGRQKADYLPMLDSHNRYSIEDVLGHMSNIRTEGTDTVVTCNFDKNDEASVKVYKKYRDGHARGFSVGYSVMKYVDIAPGQSATVQGKTYTAGKERKLRLVTDWRPYEGSAVAIGADRFALTRGQNGSLAGTRGASVPMSDDEYEILVAEGKVQVRQHDAQEEAESVAADVPGTSSERQESGQHPTIVINVNSGEPVRSASPVEVVKPSEQATSVVADESKPERGAETEESALDSVNSTVPADVGGNQERVSSMATENADNSAADSEKVRSEAIAEGIRIEGERRKAISGFAGDDVSPECVQRCLDDSSITPTQAQGLFLEDIRASRQAASRPAGSDSPTHVTSGRGATSKKPNVDVLTAAVTLRLGGEAAVRMLPYMQYDPVGQVLRMRRLTHQITEEDRKAHERVVNEAYAFERRASVDICRESLRIAEREMPDFDEDIVTRAFSTPTVSTIYTQTMGAVLLANIGETTDSTEGWVNEQDVKNFKPNELHRLEGGRLKARNRGEKARQATFADTMESYRLKEYSNTLIIDRQDLIDDDLNAWLTAMAEYALGINDLRPSLVYGFISTNGALTTDNVPLFHAASHSNLITGSALSATTLQTALSTLASQRNSNGLNLNLRNAYLITSETLSFTADQLTASAEVRNTTTSTVYGTANPIRQRNVATRSDSRLNNGFVYPATDAAVAAAGTTWYVAAAKGAYGIHVGYRAGTNRMPTMTTKQLTGGGEYGLALDVCHDIGVGVASYQGLVKATA